MKPLLQQLFNWHKTSLGHIVAEAERRALTKFLAKSMCVLQLGGNAEIDLADKLLVKQYIHVIPDEFGHVNKQNTYVRAEFDQLPFLPESLDVVLIPHILEFVDNPEMLLQALQPLVAAEGLVVVLSFNPVSLWGIYKGFKKKCPWNGKFYTALRLHKWLTAAGFEVEHYETIFFRPPLRTKTKLRKLLFMEAIGRILWCNWGAVNVLVAKKRVATLTPTVKPIFTKQIPIDKAVLKPSIRVTTE